MIFTSRLFGKALLCSASFSIQGVVVAQAPISVTEPVVVTASRSEQTVNDALPNTQVITRKDIERSAASDVPDLLRMMSATDTSQTGGSGKVTSVFLRGAESRHTLVLVDGVPLNKPDFGSASFEHLALEQIERIEIVRGNLSSLYGSQAVGGVIQIFTKQSAGLSAALTAGSQRTANASVSYGAKWSDTQLGFTLSHQQTQGISAQNPATYPGADADKDGYRNNAVSGYFSQRIVEGHDISLRLSNTDAQNEYDNAFASSQPPVSTSRLQTASLISRNQFTANWLSTVTLAGLCEKLSDPSGFSTEARNRTTQLAWDNDFNFAADQSLQFGLERKRSRFEDEPSSNYQPRNTDSARLGYLGRSGPLDWQFNIRRDRTNDVGSANTGYAGLGYKLDTQWKLIGSVSNSFSAPNFIDLLFADPAAPKLKAERGRTAELGVQYAWKDFRVRVTAFNARIRDKIDFDPITFFTSNIARSSNKGLELSATLNLPIGKLGLEASINDPRNDDTGQRLLRRSRENLALNYNVDDGLWSTGAYLKYVGARLDADPVSFTTVSNAAYTRADFTLGYALSKQWSLRAKLQNAFNNSRDEVLGYSATPRGVFLTLQYRD